LSNKQFIGYACMCVVLGITAAAALVTLFMLALQQGG
jgi:hypothetical protein